MFDSADQRLNSVFMNGVARQLQKPRDGMELSLLIRVPVIGARLQMFSDFFYFAQIVSNRAFVAAHTGGFDAFAQICHHF